MEIEYPTHEERQKAIKLYESENIEIGSNAKASHTPEGVWVEAWVWVPKKEIS